MHDHGDDVHVHECPSIPTQGYWHFWRKFRYSPAMSYVSFFKSNSRRLYGCVFLFELWLVACFGPLSVHMFQLWLAVGLLSVHLFQLRLAALWFWSSVCQLFQLWRAALWCRFYVCPFVSTMACCTLVLVFCLSICFNYGLLLFGFGLLSVLLFVSICFVFRCDKAPL